MKVAHQIREQLEYYRKSQGSLVANRAEDGSLMDMKQATRNLISYNDHPLDEEGASITPSNFLRPNNEGWEPRVEVLDAGEMRKFQKLEERQNRYARRTR